ncbi:MAG: hypothetical protein HYZ42_11570, partial [Bacteroidetes bacterium]|nr:hypothetical protein [Bacteroidota bacterium]
MLKEDFENKISNKLDDASVEPSLGGWEKIASRLPEEEKKKVAWWFLSSGKKALVLGGMLLLLIGFFVLKPTSETRPTAQIADIKVSEGGSTLNSIDESGVVDTKKNITNINNPAHINRQPRVVSRIASIIAPQSSSNLNTPAKESIEPIYFGENGVNTILPSIVLVRNVGSASNLKLMIGELDTKIDEDEMPQRKPDDTIYNYIIGANGFLMATYRHIGVSSQATQTEKDQVKLRNQIEYSNADFNGGLFIKRKIKNNWYLGVGINIYNCSERINFASKANVQDVPAPSIVMNDKFRINNQNNANVFKLSGDS